MIADELIRGITLIASEMVKSYAANNSEEDTEEMHAAVLDKNLKLDIKLKALSEMDITQAERQLALHRIWAEYIHG